MVMIYIEKSPLHIIVRSALEVYNRETLGCLYGVSIDRKSGKCYVIESAQPYQKAERKPSGVKVEDGSVLNWEDLVGDYHSHTKKNNGSQPQLALTQEDLDDLVTRKNDLSKELVSLLLTVNKTNRICSFKHYCDEIFGTILFNDFNFLIHIKGYYLNGRRKRIADLKVQDRILKKIFE